MFVKKAQCKMEKTANDLQMASNAKQREAVLDVFLKKKISEQNFKKKINELEQAALQSKESLDLMKCNMDKCKQATRELLKTRVKTMTYDCAVEKKKEACAKEKKTKKILENKNPNVTEFFTI